MSTHPDSLPPGRESGSIAGVTGAKRTWWWLVGGGLMMASGIVLMVTVGAVGCSAGGFESDGSLDAAVAACEESINAAQRNWTVGLVLLLVGLAVVAYDVGYRRGHRSGHERTSAEAAS